MTPKSLFTIIIKIFGLFFFLEIIKAVPGLFTTFVYIANEASIVLGLSSLFFSLILLVFYGFIAWYLLFNAGKVLNILQLDKDFEQDEFSFEVSQDSVFIIALMVTGGVILADEIPNFCRILFSYIQISRATLGPTQNDYSLIIFSGLKIILGLLIIGERQWIVNFISRKQEIEPNE